MSAVFGGSPVTRNRQFDPSQDNKTQNLRKLNPQAMSSPSALAGTHGTHADLIHGPCWHHIEGPVTKNLQKTLTTTIALNEIRNVMKDKIMHIGGILNQTVTGSTVYTHIDTVLHNYLQVVTRIHASPMMTFQPTRVFDYIKSKTQVGWYNGTLAIENWQATVDNWQYDVNNWQVNAYLNFNIAPCSFDASGDNMASRTGFEGKVQALGSKIWAGHVLFGGPDIKATAADIAAGPSTGTNNNM